MPRRWRIYMNGYMSGASTEPDPKMMIAPRISSRTTSGMSHHFFSWRRKRINSFANCHMLAPNAVEVRARAQVKGVAQGGGRGHETIGQSVFADFGELAASLNYGGFAFFAAEINVAVRENGRGGVIATDAFAPDLRAGFGFHATGDAAVIDHVKQIINQ